MAGTTHMPLVWGSSRSLDLSRGPLVMGILNCTPDSFFPASRQRDTNTAVRSAFDMIEQGADIIDIGGESTRPGAEYVSPDEEIGRVVPVIESIRAESKIAISVDTRKRDVAEAALDAGADMVNDVSGLRDDPGLRKLMVERNVPVVIMHMRGTSQTMQKHPHYDDTVEEVRDELLSRVDEAIEAGVSPERIILDPGIGFGKRLEDNLRLIRHLARIRDLGYPVLIGISRKSFIDAVLGRAVEDRLIGTVAAEAYAILHGADIIRVHDVRETVDLVRMLGAIGHVES